MSTTKAQKIRAVIYARTSTDDGRQKLDNQLIELRRYAKQMGWQVVSEYNDEASARSESIANRPAMRQLFADAAQAKFDRVLVWALDRWTRAGVAETFIGLKRLKEHKVDFWSYTQEHFRTAGPYGDCTMAWAAQQAEYESTVLSTRIRAGMKRAKEAGTKLGRRRKITVTPTRILKLQRKGMGMAEICAKLRVSRATLYARLGEQRAS